MATIGALVFTGLTLKVTQGQYANQNELTAQSQYTDRYTKAVEQVSKQGANEQHIRLGGIYALERLAWDSPRDQPNIIEVLAALVRNSNPLSGNKSDTCLRPTVDVQAALTVLGRRNFAHDDKRRIDLSFSCMTEINLENANLANANLMGANLVNANLSAAILSDADLKNANLTNATLTSASLTDANMDEADLTHANLFGANLIDASLVKSNLFNGHLIRAKMNSASLSYANLKDASLQGADLTDASLTYANLTNTHMDAGTNLRYAWFNGANMKGANLEGANLEGADLREAIHDSTTKVAGVSTNSMTEGEWW